MALRSPSLNTFMFLFNAGTETDSIRNVFPKFIGRDQTGTWKRRRIPRSVHGEQRRQTSEFLLLLFREFFFPLILFIQSPSSVGVIPDYVFVECRTTAAANDSGSLINKLHRLLSTQHILYNPYTRTYGGDPLSSVRSAWHKETYHFSLAYCILQIIIIKYIYIYT